MTGLGWGLGAVDGFAESRNHGLSLRDHFSGEVFVLGTHTVLTW